MIHASKPRDDHQTIAVAYATTTISKTDIQPSNMLIGTITFRYNVNLYSGNTYEDQIRGLFKKYADCVNYATRVGFRRIRLVSLGLYRSAD